MVRDLAHVVKREKAQIGVFITLAEPTKPMLTEAVKEGYYESLYGNYSRLQILTIEELLNGKQPNIQLIDPSSFKKATKEITSKQQGLSF
jgi:site-specific DNA-methyltransferase (adenine-specific)